jgi:hypothetical protein
MMRSARAVSTKLVGQQEARFRRRIYGTPIDCLVIILRASQSGRLAPPLSRGEVSAFVKGRGTIDYHPGDSGNLVRQGYDDLIDMHAALQRFDPRPQPVPLAIEVDDA